MIKIINKITIILFSFNLVSCSADFDHVIEPSVGENWPQPKSVEKYNNFLFIDPNKFEFLVMGETCYILEEALRRYKKIIKLSVNSPIRDSEKVFIPSQLVKIISINLTTPCELYPYMNMDERYFVAGAGRIKANSVWGILRGLETFSQLITPGPHQMLQIRHVTIYDSPRFTHRGLLLDTARHFISVNKIFNILDGMAYDKLNVFHWHIINDESFPYQSIRFPKLSEKGAYTPSMIYTQQRIKNIIGYARIRGIRVVPEFDIFVLCRAFINYLPELLKESDVNGSTISAKDNLYKNLEYFYSEIVDIFPDKHIHLGLYVTDNTIITNKFNTDEEFVIDKFFERILIFLIQKKCTPIIWQGEMNEINLPKETIIQLRYRGIDGTENAFQFTEFGYRVLKSDSWLLYNLTENWKDIYKWEPLKYNYPQKKSNLISGGEGLLWTENVNDNNVIDTIFPKLCAIAEKLWSTNYMSYTISIASRIEEHICRLIFRGVNAAPAFGPGICG